MKQVFKVSEVVPIGEDTFLVNGRAYEDVKIGDILFAILAETVEPRKMEAPQCFKVIAISTYTRQIEELSRMLTGSLTLQGDQGENLKEETMLVIPVV